MDIAVSDKHTNLLAYDLDYTRPKCYNACPYVISVNNKCVGVLPLTVRTFLRLNVILTSDKKERLVLDLAAYAVVHLEG